MRSRYCLAFCFALLATIVTVSAAPAATAAVSQTQELVTQAISRRGTTGNRTAVALPDTFATSDASTLPSRQFTLIYSHDQIDVQPDTTLTALHFGSSNLSQALDAAIVDATNQAKTGGGQPQTHYNTSFSHLSLIVTPVANVQHPLLLTWTDFATILQVLRNDTLQRPHYSTLFVGLVGDTGGNVYAEVAIVPEVVFVSQAATMKPITNLNETGPSQSTFVGKPGRHLQWGPPSSSDDENAEDASDSDTESAERQLGVSRDGPPIRDTDLTMHVTEFRRGRIAADRLREAYGSLRDFMALLPQDEAAAHVSGRILSPTIILRRPGNSVYAEFGILNLTYHDREESQLTSRELHAVFAALDVLMSQLETIAFPPSVEIYRSGETYMIAHLYFWHETAHDEVPLVPNEVINDLTTQSRASSSSSDQIGPPPPGASLDSTSTADYATPSSLPFHTILDSGSWDSIAERLEASNRRDCSWWTTCFTGSWPQP